MVHTFIRSSIVSYRSIIRRKMAFSCPPERLLRGAVTASVNRSRATVNGMSTSSGGATYRAAVVTELGKPLEIQNIDRPAEVPEGHIRMDVHHSAINFADILISQGKYQEKPMLPFCPGSEFAGVVTEVGPGVTNHMVGERVFGVAPMAGGYASQNIVNAASMFPIPDNMTTDVACSLLIVYGTAMMSLQRRAGIKPGDTVLVTSAAGGVGMAAVDLAANYFQAKVIGACSTDDKCKIAASHGAHHTINYSTDNLSARVKEITNGQGADIIVDNVGGDIMNQCLKSVAFEGRILVIGFASGDIPKIPANLLLVKSCSAVGVYWGSYSHRHPQGFRESINNVLGAYRSGKITPHISAVYRLDQVNDAFKSILDRKSTGKVVLNCQA